jgi:hypothetical protein
MAAGGRKTADDALALALAAGRTAREAAAACGLSERTAYRRLADPAFRRRADALRADLVDRALGRLADGMADAADTLRLLLGARSESVRLGAARALLEVGAKLRESVDLEQRLRAVEQRTAPDPEEYPP